MIKTGIIGYGYSAQTFHLPLMAASAQFRLTSISTSKTGPAKEKHSGIRLYPTAQQLIDESDTQLIVIAAPNDVHYALARQCLENNKHVILEKPMVISGTEGEALLALAKSKNLLLSVFHNRRWDGDFLTVKKLIHAGTLGDVRFFESHFDRFRPTVQQRWREQAGPGSGIWFDLGSHLLDQAVCLFGLPEAITARCLALRDHSPTTDYFHVLLHYSGCEAILHAGSFAAAPNIRFQIQGTHGSYIKYGYDPQEEQLKKAVTPNDPAFGYEAAENFGTLFTETGAPGKPGHIIATEPGRYLSFYSAIADSINQGSPAPVDAETAIRIVQILELAESSSRQRKTLPLDLS